MIRKWSVWCLHNIRIIFSHWKEWVRSISVDPEACRQCSEWEKQNSDNSESLIFVYTYMYVYCVCLCFFYIVWKDLNKFGRIYTNLSTGFPLRLVGLCWVPRRAITRKERGGKQVKEKNINSWWKKAYLVSYLYICAKLSLCGEESHYFIEGAMLEKVSPQSMCLNQGIPSATVWQRLFPYCEPIIKICCVCVCKKLTLAMHTYF